MAKILKANGVSWEDMIACGLVIECEYDCQIGDIIDGCFVYCGRSPDDNTCRKGDTTLLIPLRFISVAETHSDLFKHGFIKVNETNRWVRLH